ncbi:Cysteine sulfinate desulfinase/cysteine desulfurase related enzyme [Lactococcus cremoris subsp. cremoris SK11]|uniref:Cysteine sulfinate desulfinase/cysteine desulfurase related enzyme n=2 Tax=Lactococcus lactis subsp. cremoris TaxID=1359 RepID=Q031J4_LACLS|nr:cysteine desulfurase family protein [Lactococcus cremoris]ABJ72128.1 Cysteine sulfinate desulfinase/cysteine desulfurase related enzyme [Lactococcus cremoris subsp. cremoris SK11]ARE22728.1 cysteine desulfurase family protein [Lactococcus cremoris]KZK44654.1 putative cysteine desulfurase associated with tRNA 4-thiouridine synthase [Lactococcus cremoris]KZK53277.1 putative cysteine desulfurase associated with tRNA 4-thiouridine synthase [Lactococcus cremoris]MCT4409624.1 cysteine desulfurase
MIYFDNSATTAVNPMVLRTYTDVATKIMGNPSSLHGLGTTATRLLEASRRQIAELLGLDSQEIFFTSGGTEGDNWIIKGVAFEKRPYGNHIIVSSVEHPAVKNAAEWLKTQGFELDYAPVDADGFVIVSELEKLIRDETILISVMAVNNEVGAIQPIQEISELLADKPTISFHVDAVQAIGKVPLETWLTDRLDFATLSAHKFHGPRGVGIVVAKKGKRLTPLLHGGGQEHNWRSTTENLAGIAATSKALRLAVDEDDFKRKKMLAMKQAILEELEKYKKVYVFSKMTDFAPNILTFGIRGVRGEVVVHAFEQHDIYISTTSACSSKKNAADGTLVAMNVPSKLATSAVRISLDPTNNMAEVEQFLTVFRQIYQELEKVSG